MYSGLYWECTRVVDIITISAFLLPSRRDWKPHLAQLMHVYCTITYSPSFSFFLDELLLELAIFILSNDVRMRRLLLIITPNNT